MADYQNEEERPRNAGMASGYLCPHCGGKDTRRTHRHGWEHILRLLGVRVFRCMSCKRRIYRRRR